MMKTFPASIFNAILFACLFGFCQTAMCDENPANKTSPEIVVDWIIQELKPGQQLFQSANDSTQENAVITKILAELEDNGDQFQGELKALQGKPGNDPQWKALFDNACTARREQRLLFLHEENAKFVFVKRHTILGSHYAYTEGLSDANGERYFKPGSQLCLLEFCDDGTTKQTVLLDCPNGVIRDPAISCKGDYIVFAMKQSDRLDDYHLYKMNVETKEVTQITFGIGYADYEPCCLQNGEILFNSTRCVQVVDCWTTDVSNLYRVNEDGKYLRRVTVDQVHDNYPTMTDKGLILYTRWDYNDRGQIYPQGIFQMSPDGTGQTAFYGNNSWFPTSILHARGIPNSSKVLCIFSGHHVRQRGKLGVIDPRLGREEATGAQLVAPIRNTEAVHVDRYGQTGEQFCYPYPMSENDCLVSYRPNFGLGEDKEQAEEAPFGLYYMDFDGNRELLVQDPNLSCVQAVQLKEQELLFERPSQTDPTLDYSTFYIQNIFLGPGLENVDPKQVRSLRVVALDFRTNSVGMNYNKGPGGASLIFCPISAGGGAWDTKRILGEAKIYEDGSCWFRVPPMTPVYFQVIDVNGRVIQSMRSWSTLQPGEKFSCIGCHEDKNSTRTNVAGGLTQAMKNGAQDLTPFYGDVRGFSFQKEIQPILDKHCVQCHENEEVQPPYTTLTNQDTVPVTKTIQELGHKPFSLKATPVNDVRAKRVWTRSYLNLINGKHVDPLKDNSYLYQAFQTPVNNWLNVQEAPPMLKPYHAGSVKSKLSLMFDGDKPHNDVQLSQEEKDKLNAWIDLAIPFCGTYDEANLWDESDQDKIKHQRIKRLVSERLNEQNTEAWLKSKTPRKHGKKAEFVIEGANNPYRALNAAIEPMTENDVTTWTFERPIRTDQITLPAPATGPMEFQFSNGFRVTIPTGKTSVVFSMQECTSISVRNCDMNPSIMGIVR